ncbi:MAG: response regulator transcription factor [Candidatus Izemoplasmatales bacterium]|nr:response regulator transcription factor [Candidatus Izemoplasmatales bacterium]
MKILIVEDHLKINELLAKFAKGEKHHVFQAYTAEQGLAALALNQFDLVITDLMLPHLQGEDLIKRIRKESDIYIIVISAKTEMDDKIDVLKLGADDYLTKPFSVKEVMVKLKNIEKRIEKIIPTYFSYYHNELIIYPEKREVLFNKKNVKLTNYEFEVLMLLVSRPQYIFSRAQIIDQLFSESEAYDRVIDVYIKNIRKALNDDVFKPRYIKTHYGVGYQFVGEKDD